MPNWCSTTINIFHKDKNELDKLNSLIAKWTSKNYMENGFGFKWLGNIVIGSGIGTVDTGKKTDFRCRGYITYFENYGDMIVIDTETAWTPMLKMWTAILNKYLPDATMTYTAMECGSQLYCTNDLSYKNLYYVDSFEIDEIESGDYSTSEIVEVINNFLGIKTLNAESAINAIETSEKYGDKISICKWEYTNIDEFE